MKKFDQLTGVAAPLNILNIDTDMIIPKQFLKTIKRTGLGYAAYADLRSQQARDMLHTSSQRIILRITASS